MNEAKGEAMDKRCEQMLPARGKVSEVMYCPHCQVFHVNVDGEAQTLEVLCGREEGDRRPRAKPRAPDPRH